MTNAHTDFRMLAATGGALLEYKTSDIIFKRGDAAQNLFIVQSGKVEIRLGNRVVETVSDNDIFGEMAMIDFAPRSATAVAISDTTLIPIGEAHGMGLGLAICRMIIERHAGELSASSDGESAALFQFVLPSEPMDRIATSVEHR